MDADGLKELFAPFGPVETKRMFSGHGVYADGLCFALHLRGEVYLKADDENRAEFVAAGSDPFVYEAKGEARIMSYYRLVASAYDDEDELRRWAGLGLAAARRSAAAKAMPRTSKAKKPKATAAKAGRR